MTQVKCASPVVYTGGRRGEYVRFKGVDIPDVDDGSLPDDTNPKLYIGQPYHRRVRDIVEPTEKTKQLVEKYSHLIENVDYAFQIRRCGLSKSQNVNNDPGKNNDFCTNATLEKFYDVLKTRPGNVFVSSDCYETKMDMFRRYPNRVRVIDADPTHVSSDSSIDVDPWLAFTEFFLLSKCPVIYMTGGKRDMTTFSTFGYMASIYGNTGCIAIFNDDN